MSSFPDLFLCGGWMCQGLQRKTRDTGFRKCISKFYLQRMKKITQVSKTVMLGPRKEGKKTNFNFNFNS